MGCLLPVLAVFFPRLVMICILIFTGWFGKAYESFIWPFLGFLFFPFTTLAYMAAMLNNNHQVSTGWLVLLIIAVLIDLGGSGFSARYESGNN